MWEKQNITVSIRPESIRLVTKPENEGCIYIKGRVRHSMFLGEKVRYFIVDQQDKEWIADAFDTGMQVHEGDIYMEIQQGKPHLISE